jgi:transcriptional regulator with XRE-family HTH domain
MKREKVAERMKKIRELKGFSLEDIVRHSGVDMETVTALEEGRISPSLANLTRISRALGERLGTFLDDQVSEDPLVVRLEERQSDSVPAASRPGADSLVFHSLGRGKTDRHMEPFYVEILPVPEKEVVTSTHEGEEFIVVVSGRIGLQYGEKRVELKEGDSVYYNSVVPHRVMALNGRKAGIYAVVYAPR